MSTIKEIIIKWLGGYTKTEYNKLQNEINDIDKTNKVDTVSLTVISNPTDIIKVNGMTIDQKDMPLKFIKGNPVEIAVYDSEGKLYPSLKMTDV